MLDQFRWVWAAAMRPPAKLLLRLGVTPDAVTWAGTIAVCVAVLATVPRGLLWQGGVLMLLLVLSDGLDGEMARQLNRPTTYGAFLDSSLDRVADGAVFGAVTLWFASIGRAEWSAVSLWALVMGQVTSYVKARADSLGLDGSGGVAARADRIVLVFLGLVLAGAGVPWALEVSMALLAVAATWTVGQRMARAKASAVALPGAGQPEGPA